MGIILTRPQGSGSGIPGTVTAGITIPGVASSPNNIVDVDQCPTLSNSSVKWLYTLIDQTHNKVVAGEVLGTHRNGTNPTFNQYALIGDITSMAHSINVLTQGGNLILQITNLTNNVLTCNVTRIQILS